MFSFWNNFPFLKNKNTAQLLPSAARDPFDVIVTVSLKHEKNEEKKTGFFQRLRSIPVYLYIYTPICVHTYIYIGPFGVRFALGRKRWLTVRTVRPHESRSAPSTYHPSLFRAAENVNFVRRRWRPYGICAEITRDVSAYALRDLPPCLHYGL